MISHEKLKPRILVVDDERASTMLICASLTRQYQCCAAHNGEAAIAKAREARPDILLLDLHMPGLSGVQVMEAVNEMYPEHPVPVIFITGQDEPHIEADLLYRGAVDFIAKPVHPKVVEARIQTQLHLIEKTQALKLANEQLTRLALTDPLTQLANRRCFYNSAEKELSRAKRFNLPLCLVMIDLDHFKQINDRFGHASGDAVLSEFGEEARRFLRKSDCCARLGGEEFALLLPHTPLDEAMLVAERLKSAVGDVAFQSENGTAFNITISCGVTEFSADDGNIDQVLKRADEALYRAKKQGRNRVLAALRPPELSA